MMTSIVPMLTNIILFLAPKGAYEVQIKDPIRDSGGATYSLDIAGDLTFVFCDHPVLYYYLE